MTRAKRCGVGRALIAVAALQIGGVAIVGGIAREICMQRPSSAQVTAEHLIDQLIQHAGHHDGWEIHPPGDVRWHVHFGGNDAHQHVTDRWEITGGGTQEHPRSPR